ncbi:flagellar basal-body rod protein FlgG [Pelotomaculum sp. FP]|uniref:flagellar basal-body rod protein FlgG n=1 Tax=Pelotomaculum sp. FP TaxID=261474 RepID=UPI0010654235|nr:flagellar basal-body rod protein FlgG [Pelotomaculum sp. FP]
MNVLRALGSGASGLNAQQIKVDISANNLANINTPGFKKSSPDFFELVSQDLLNSGIPATAGDNRLALGSGVHVAEVTRIYEQGNMIETGASTDLAIQGEGFFKVLLPDGEERYTRGGSFTLDPEGNIVTSAGYILEGIQMTPGSSKINVARDGTVSVVNHDETITVEGQIQLYQFTNAAGLQAAGENLYSFNGPAAEVVAGDPGTGGVGIVRQGCLEKGNVDLVEEMTNLIEAQRAYGFNTRIVRTADEMWSMANSLRK